MRRLIRPLNFLFLFTALLSAGCVLAPRFGSTTPFSDGTTPKKKILASERNTSNPMAAFEAQIYDQLMAGDFAGIDAEAASARKSKERFRGGFWKISSIYSASNSFYAEYPGQEVTDEMWKNRIELLTRWKDENPNSVTARISLAQAYHYWAWFARGDGYINTVSERDYALMKERLQIAEKELWEATGLKERCPELADSILSIAVVNRWAPEKFDELFEKAVKAEPNFINYYLAKSDALKPKWGGSEIEWQRFVDSIPSKVLALGSNEGDMIYFAVVADKLDDHTFSNNWAMISKDRIKKGFADMEKKFTPSKYRLNQFAYISTVTRDLESARAAFERIGTDRNDAVWSEGVFNTMKKIAYGEKGAS